MKPPQWIVVIGSQGVVYPTQDGVNIIECKPVLGAIENATRFTNARRAVETARKSSTLCGQPAKVMLVRDAIINHETPGGAAP